MAPGNSGGQPRQMCMGPHGRNISTKMHIQKDTNNGVCLGIQIGVNVNINKSDGQLDQFVPLSGEEDEIQGRLNGDEFLIQKQGFLGIPFQGLPVPALQILLLLDQISGLDIQVLGQISRLIYDLRVEIHKEQQLLFLSPLNCVIVQSCFKLWQLVAFVIL